ncbi:PadR family transcriptional regulator [Solibacillus ferritrahens]|uniref:PadR family transcriptional regulator n=1 Tax=Solibacillus ferritrahens TaxID=3098620 RepID=UPI003009F1DC
MIPLSEPTYLILLALIKEPTHGYGIIKAISEVSEGQYEIAPGTLYGVLKNIEKQKLIEVVGVDLDNRKKKIYAITDAGKEALIYEQRRYEKLLLFTYKLNGEG